MQNKSMHFSKNVIIYIFLSAVLIFVFLTSIAVGSVKISLSEVANIIVEKIQDDSVNSTIVWKIRLPRTLAAMVGGAAIAVAGLLLQVFSEIPL